MQTNSLDVLENAKLPPDQARAILKVMETEFALQHGDLATRTDLRDAMHAARSEMREAIHALDLKIESVRSDLVRWVFVCTFGQAALLAGLVVYFVLTYVRR
jgi:hypothetical protein